MTVYLCWRDGGAVKTTHCSLEGLELIPSIQTRQVPTAFNSRSRALLPLTSHGMYAGIALERVKGKEGREICQDATVFKLSPFDPEQSCSIC